MEIYTFDADFPHPTLAMPFLEDKKTWISSFVFSPCQSKASFALVILLNENVH